MYDNIRGKLVFVTGSGSGIGKAIARTLASEGAEHASSTQGDWAERTAREIIEKGGKATSAKLDVTAKAEVDSVIDSCWKEQVLFIF